MAGDVTIRSNRVGVSISLFASVLFGVIFYLAGTATSSPEVVFAWRVIATALCYVPFLAHRGSRMVLAQFWSRMTSRWWMPGAFGVFTAIVGFEMWLFVWAPSNGYGLDLSLGLLLLPICLVLGGRFILRSSVSRTQWVVVVLAAVATGVKIAATPELSWVTVAACVPFTAYFVGRRQLQLNNPAAFAVEMTLVAPVAAVLAGGLGDTWTTEAGLLILVALASAVAMTAYVAASALLPIPLFGLLSYVEPVLLVGVAILLGERMFGADIVVYTILAVALTLLALAGLRDARKMPRLRSAKARVIAK